jgi:dephospho-CoA kinase
MMNRPIRPLYLQRVIGITGGISTGKTTVSRYLAASHHLPVLDADVFAREAVEPGSGVLGQIIDRYGTGILQPNGGLDRARLGEIVFHSAPERLWLEQQIHPYVRERFARAMSPDALADPQRYPVVVMVIPLLFEVRMTDLVTETWVIYCKPELQLQRLMSRDRLSREQAEARIRSQMSLDTKASHADLVLDNSSTHEALLNQIDQALNTPIQHHALAVS